MVNSILCAACSLIIPGDDQKRSVASRASKLTLRMQSSSLLPADHRLRQIRSERPARTPPTLNRQMVPLLYRLFSALLSALISWETNLDPPLAPAHDALWSSLTEHYPVSPSRISLPPHEDHKLPGPGAPHTTWARSCGSRVRESAPSHVPKERCPCEAYKRDPLWPLKVGSELRSSLLHCLLDYPISSSSRALSSNMSAIPNLPESALRVDSIDTHATHPLTDIKGDVAHIEHAQIKREPMTNGVKAEAQPNGVKAGQEWQLHDQPIENQRPIRVIVIGTTVRLTVGLAECADTS